MFMRKLRCCASGQLSNSSSELKRLVFKIELALRKPVSYGGQTYENTFLLDAFTPKIITGILEENKGTFSSCAKYAGTTADDSLCLLSPIRN